MRDLEKETKVRVLPEVEKWLLEVVTSPDRLPPLDDVVAIVDDWAVAYSRCADGCWHRAGRTEPWTFEDENYYPLVLVHRGRVM